MLFEDRACPTFQVMETGRRSNRCVSPKVKPVYEQHIDKSLITGRNPYPHETAIYVLEDDCAIYYVGKTSTTLTNRYKQHRQSKPELFSLTTKMRVIVYVPHEIADEIERTTIRAYDEEGCPLINERCYYDWRERD